MKPRQTGNIIFFVVTLIVCLAGTIFVVCHRWDITKPPFSRANILAIGAGCFLTVAELAFIYLHSLIDCKEMWRRIVAYTLSIGLICTITYATYTEASAFIQEGDLAVKAKVVSDFNERQASNASTSDRRFVMRQGNAIVKEFLKDMKSTDFVPFAINFFFGLFCIITGKLIQPREAWKRKRGNVMNPAIAKATERKTGFFPQNATAYQDGKGSSIVVKNGREYITTLSNKEIEEIDKHKVV